MTNLLKCLTCDKILTSEEAEKHKCKPVIHRHKIIQVASFFSVIDDDGNTNLVVDGFDHIGYLFKIKEPKLIPLDELSLPDQPKGNTYKNNQEGNRTLCVKS